MMLLRATPDAAGDNPSSSAVPLASVVDVNRLVPRSQSDVGRGVETLRKTTVEAGV